MAGKVVIFTDPGEEIDDEIALWEAEKIFSSYLCQGRTFNVHVVAVGGKLESVKRIERCKAVLGPPKCLHYWTPGEFQANLMLGAAVLIIGPLELSEDSDRIISEDFAPNLVVLAGSMNSSVNWGSTATAQRNCQKLLDISKQHVIIDSAALSRRKMTSEFVSELPKKLCDGVALLTWRFLLGRARAPAKFVAHLLSPTLALLKERPASNYVAIQTVFEHLNSVSLKDSENFTEISVKARQFADDYAANNLDGLEEYCKEMDVSQETIVEEYAQAMGALLKLGWYQDKVLLSEDLELSDEVLLKNPSENYLYFKEEVFVKIGSPLPCYDYTALHEFLKYI